MALLWNGAMARIKGMENQSIGKLIQLVNEFLSLPIETNLG